LLLEHIRPILDQLEVQPIPDQLEIQPVPDQHSISQLDQLENQPTRLDQQHPILQLEDEDNDDSVNQLAEHPLLELVQLEEDYFPNTPNTADKEVPDDSSEYSNSNSRLTSLSKGTDISSKSLFGEKGGNKEERDDEDSDVFQKMKSFFGIDSPPKSNGVKQSE
jgi:hypothetical protein